MRVVFSRDRAAQLDLLIRSLDTFLVPEPTRVIWVASNDFYRAAYAEVTIDPEQEPDGFNQALHAALSASETVTFLCDDDVVYRPCTIDPAVRLADPKVLTFSLRLGRGNKQQPLPAGFPRWQWWPLPRHDFGYPASVDGHTFRTDDVLAVLGNTAVSDPTWLETVLARRIANIAGDRPLMESPTEQVLVGVPVNRTSPSSGVAHGEHHPQPLADLNERFLAGERISLDALDLSGVDACHHEVAYTWEAR